MDAYFLFFAAMLIIGIIMIVLGIMYRRKWSPTGIAYMILFGIITVIASGVMCLCIGFFMR